MVRALYIIGGMSGMPFLHGVSIAADRIVCLGGSYIVKLSVDDVGGVVELMLRL